MTTHRRSGPAALWHRLRTPRLVAGAVAAALLVGSGAVVTRVVAGDDPVAPCDSTRAPLRVAADPAIAATVAGLVREHRQDLSEVGCDGVVVHAVTPAAEIEALADGAIRPPDVWIPDSSLWLDQAAHLRVASAPDAPSVASSPLVLAVSSIEADRLRDGHARPTVADVAKASARGDFSVALPGRSSLATVATVAALTEAAAGAPDPRATLTAILRASSVREGSEPAHPAPLSPADGVGVPTSEQQVWATNDAQDAQGANDAARPVAIYTRGVSDDYPFAVLTDDPGLVPRAQLLLELLTGHTGRIALQEAGFRDAHGSAGVTLTPDRGVEGRLRVTPRPPAASTLDRARQALAATTMRAQLLAVMDVSGSMAWGLTGAWSDGPSRLSVATGAAAQGMRLYPDGTRVGLWAFSEDLVGARDHRVVVPITRLGGNRTQFASALGRLAPIRGGDTALYATVLAAVRHMAAHWEPGRVNAVVILSDGRDTDAHGPTLEAVVAALRAQRQSARPVPVITIAFGPSGDTDALAAISRASGGAAYHADTASQVRQIFLDAVGQRACRPHCH